MKLSKRIKQIAALTVEDFYNSGKSTNESKESLVSWLSDALMQDESIEDAYAYEISIKVLDMLKSLDVVDLGFIIELMADDLKLDETSIPFSEVAL